MQNYCLKLFLKCNKITIRCLVTISVLQINTTTRKHTTLEVPTDYQLSTITRKPDFQTVFNVPMLSSCIYNFLNVGQIKTCLKQNKQEHDNKLQRQLCKNYDKIKLFTFKLQHSIEYCKKYAFNRNSVICVQVTYITATNVCAHAHVMVLLESITNKTKL